MRYVSLSRSSTYSVDEKSGAGRPRPHVLQLILRRQQIYGKILVLIAANPGEIMTLATGVRHNVIIPTF